MRAIDELIWHCTATPEGREVTAREIDQWHKARGWKGIGYHKVVHLDGTVSEGRPAREPGSHVAGRNRFTLGYVYVGGVDARNRPKDTRTPEQKETMERLTREAIEEYGIKIVSGHRQYAAKACPCFDAAKEYMPLVKDRAGGGRDPTKLSRSRTVQASAAGAGGGLAIMGDAIAEFMSADEYINAGSVFSLIVGMMIVGAAVWALYARWDDAGRPTPWRRG